MEVLTNTKRRDFQTCPRYFYHRHVLGLELISKKQGRRRGAAFGDALQAARDWEVGDQMTGDQDGDVWEAHDPGHAAVLALDEIYADLYDRVNSQAELDALEIEHIKVRVMTLAYIERYGLKARREVEFELPLPTLRGYSRTFKRGGKIDGVEVVGPKRGRVIEDKFVAQIQKAMIDRLPLDAQASEYVDALLARGWSAEVAYRHTRVPGKNPLPPKEFKTKADYPGETLAEYEERIREDVQLNPDAYFDEQILIFPQVHLDDFRASRYGIARQIMHARVLAREESVEVAYPLAPSRCWEYGGCEFIPLCTKTPDAIDRYQVVRDNVELSEGSEDVTSEYGPTGGAEA